MIPVPMLLPAKPTTDYDSVYIGALIVLTNSSISYNILYLKFTKVEIEDLVLTYYYVILVHVHTDEELHELLGSTVSGRNRKKGRGWIFMGASALVQCFFSPEDLSRLAITFRLFREKILFLS